MANTYNLIQGYTLGSDVTGGVTFSTIPQTFTHLVFRISARSGQAGAIDDMKISINGNSSATYANIRLYGEFAGGSFVTGQDGGSAVGLGQTYIGALEGNGSNANIFSSCHLFIPNYTSSVIKNGYSDSSAQNNSTAASNWNKQLGTIRSSDTNPITSIKIESYNNPTLKTGSTIFLYGLAST